MSSADGCKAIYFAVLLVVVGLTVLTGCGGSSRHTTGIYAPPVPESDDGQTGTPVRSDYIPSDQHTIGGSEAKIPEYVLQPDVRAVFVDLQPEDRSTVYVSDPTISAKLLINDAREERWANLDNLQLETFTINGVEQGAQLYKQDAGFSVSLDGFYLTEAGRYTVVVALSDSDGRRYVRSWYFKYSPMPPQFSTKTATLEWDENGNRYLTGYRVSFDAPIDPMFDQILTQPANWTLIREYDGSVIEIDSVTICDGLANVVELKCSQLAESPLPTGKVTSEVQELLKAEIDFFASELPGYSFRSTARSVSDWHDPGCMSEDKECPYDLCWDDDEGPPWNEPWEPEDPVDDCRIICTCGADICYQISGDFQCCYPILYAELGRCHCPEFYLWMVDCDTKGPQGDENRQPQSPEECPKEDERELDPCPNSGLFSPYWSDGHDPMLPGAGPVPDGATLLLDSGGLGSGPTPVGPYYFDPTNTRASYVLDIGMWCLVEEPEDSGEFFWYWLSGGSISCVAGDVENPLAEIGLVSADDMAAEIALLSGEGCRWEPYHMNLGWVPEEPGEMVGLCEKILRIEMEDQCLDLWPPEPGSDMEPWPSIHVIPADILENPGSYPPSLTDPMFYHTWQDVSGRCCYVADCTEYAECDERDGSPTQRKIAWYVWPNEKVAGEFGFPYGVGGSELAWDCERYYLPHTYFSMDWDQTTRMVFGYNWKTACFKEEMEAVWEDMTQDPLLKRKDHGEIDPNPDTADNFILRDLAAEGIGTGFIYAPNMDVLEPLEEGDIEKGVPFTLYYRWRVQSDKTHCRLSSPPRMPLDGPANVDEYAGRPKLHVLGLDENNQPLEEFWAPYLNGYYGDKQNTCEKWETGAWVWPCVKPITVEEATIVGSPGCAKSFGEFMSVPSNVEYEPRGIFVLLQETDNHLLLDDYHYTADDKARHHILNNPCVCGDTTPLDCLPYLNYANGIYDGPPPFAVAKFQVCRPVREIKAVFDSRKYDPIEVRYQVPVGNTYAQGEGNGIWQNNIMPSLDPSLSEYWFPPVVLFESYINTPINSDILTLMEHLHRDKPDEDDYSNDLRRTDVDPFKFGRGLNLPPGTFRLKETEPTFVIGWDGRQWLLDEGVRKEPSLNHGEYRERSMYQQVLIEDPEVKEELTWMFPPGTYELEVVVTLDDTAGTVLPPYSLGEISIAYGAMLQDNFYCEPVDHGGYPEIQNLYDVRDIESRLYASMSRNYNDTLEAEYDENWRISVKPGWVTLYTSQEYSSCLSTRQHNRWNKMGYDYCYPVTKDFVLLQECNMFKQLDKFDYKHFISWRGLTSTGGVDSEGEYTSWPLGTIWTSTFYDSYFCPQEDKAFVDAMIEADEEVREFINDNYNENSITYITYYTGKDADEYTFFPDGAVANGGSRADTLSVFNKTN